LGRRCNLPICAARLEIIFLVLCRSKTIFRNRGYPVRLVLKLFKACSLEKRRSAFCSKRPPDAEAGSNAVSGANHQGRPDLSTEEKIALMKKKLAHRILVAATAGGVRDEDLKGTRSSQPWRA
jgi:hypothetical protein